MDKLITGPIITNQLEKKIEPLELPVMFGEGKKKEDDPKILPLPRMFDKDTPGRGYKR